MDQLRIIALCTLLALWSFSQVNGQEVKPFDLLITELMIDPYPSIGLPNFEWIEIYNQSDHAINLESFQFASNSSPKDLPAFELEPGAFVLLTDDSNETELSVFGATICLSSFPSLTNTGDAATLLDENGQVIHEIWYDRSWYSDEIKDDGGYTLEMKNPLEPCLGAHNWAASINESGGTPGETNSIWSPSTPSRGLSLLTARAISSSSILITLDRIPSETMDEFDFEISNGVSVIDIMEVEENPFSFELILAPELAEGISYDLTLLPGAVDCVDLSAGQSTTLVVILPKPLSPNDLLINEVLFDPFPNESDYIEVLNTTVQFLDLGNLWIGNFDENGIGKVIKFPDTSLIRPGELLVVSEDPSALMQRYPSVFAKQVLKMNLPSFNNTDGNVTLLTRELGQELIIDAMNYSEAMHSPFIDDREGIALERVSKQESSMNRHNWKSAAASSGYGTPTLPNSQGITANGDMNGVKLKSKTFFPQGHPTDEDLEIIFELDGSDHIASIDIYDSSGRPIRKLINNQLLGTVDRFYWDGRNSDGILSHAGVYIIFVRMFDSTGGLKTKKLPCVLSRSL